MPHRFLIVIILALAFLWTSASDASLRQDVIKGPVQGHVIQITDGDTFTVRLRIWIGQDMETHVRLAGIDAPEIHGKCEKERKLAKAAHSELERLLQKGEVVLTDIRLEKYAGRVLASAATPDGIRISEHLIGKGLARPYNGGKRDGWCG